MEIQLISSTSFFQIFLLSQKQHFTGLIPNTMLCDQGGITTWLFNSQKQPHHPILRKNKENLFTLKFVKQLVSSINCQHIIQETSSVAEIYALLILDSKKEDSTFKQYANQTVMYSQKYDPTPKYIKILDFIKSLSNRSFNEPQCPQGWCLFQQVILSRMKQPEYYFVEVFKLEGDMTFRFNYYKWVNRNATKDQFVEPSCYQIEESKDIIKVYEQNLTQKILVAVLQLISYLETSFKLQIRRLTTRYTFNKQQQAVLKGVSEMKVSAPKKFIDYNKIEPDQSMTLSQYIEIHKKLQKLPDIMVSSPVKIQKKSNCPGSFCNAILKEKLQGMEIGNMSQVISWSVIDSHSNPQIIKNLIEIGLIDIPNSSELKKESRASNKSAGEGVKVCNKCSLVYKAIIKIQKAQTDFESKELKKFSYDYPIDPMKKSSNSKSSVIMKKKNFIENNISSLKSPPRGSYLNFNMNMNMNSADKLPVIDNTARDKQHKSSLRNVKVQRRINNKSQSSFEPFADRFSKDKIDEPILKSLVGEKFKSKQELKQLLFKHFQKKKSVLTNDLNLLEKQSQLPKQKLETPKRQKSFESRKSRHVQTQQQILNKMQNLIGQTNQLTKNQRQLNVEKLSQKIQLQLSNVQKLKIKVNSYEVDGKMEINYCVLTHSQTTPTQTLFIVHDAISSYFQYIRTITSLITQQLRIILFNYPGQAYTNFSNRKLSGIQFSQIMDRFIWHLNQQELIKAERDLTLFCGIGYGGFMLKYYLNMNYRYYPNWSAVLMINSSSSILPSQQRFAKKFLQQRLTSGKQLFQSYYKQYYHINNDLIDYCKQYNEITDQGLIYLIKSQIDEQNQLVEIKSSKLKVVNKEIVLTEQPIKATKQRHSSKSPIPKKYPLMYDGKESDNYSLVTSDKFREVLEKFIGKNS